jgi:hypothetical protein
MSIPVFRRNVLPQWLPEAGSSMFIRSSSMCLLAQTTSQPRTSSSPLYEPRPVRKESPLLITMGWDYVSEPRPPTGLLFIPRVWAWGAMVMTMPAGDYSWLVHQSFLAVLPAETSGASRRNGRRSENFAYQYLKYLKGSLTRREILHGTSGFTSHPKERVLRIFIASAGIEPATPGSSGKQTNH